MAMLTPHPESAVGVSCLWDPVTSIAIAATTGASFIGEIFTGLFASDMGLWQPDCAGAVRLRRRLGREDMELFYNINAEFAQSLDARPCAQMFSEAENTNRHRPRLLYAWKGCRSCQ
jgi:uncharacterized protein